MEQVLRDTTMSSSPAVHRILVVEDDPVSAVYARRCLAALGLQADAVANAEEALSRHAEEPYRIIVSDWIMGGADGIELCRRLRALSGPYVYFLLCSAKEDRAARMNAFDAGVDDFICKPLDPDEVRARLVVANRILAAEDRLAHQLEEEARNAVRMAELNENLRFASRRFEDLFNGLPVACFTFDATGCVHEWNRAAEEAFGVPSFDTLARPVWDVLGPNDGAWTAERCAAFFSGRTREEFEWTYLGSGAPREFASRVIGLQGPAGSTMGAVCASVDVTVQKRAERMLFSEKATLEETNARLHELASKDGLTGLWNRRSFLADLEAAVSEYERTGRVFSLVLLDIDKFKSYNDTYGHPAGDEVLRRFARVLRNAARSYENPARYGGEEFAIVLHNTGTAKALAAADRFRREVEGADWIERPVTCSLGVATIGDDCKTIESIVAAADAALYASKETGRNRCTHAVGLKPLAKAA